MGTRTLISGILPPILYSYGGEQRLAIMLPSVCMPIMSVSVFS